MSEVEKTLYFTKGMAIKHGDTFYPEGELIELSDNEAKPLKRWLEPAKAQAKATNVDGEPAAKSETTAGGADNKTAMTAADKKGKQK